MAQKFTDNSDGTVNVDITCDKCGGPITHANEYGMFCEKECDLEKSKEAKALFDSLFKIPQEE